MQLQQLTPKTGTEIRDLDLATASEDTLKELKSLLAERLVLVFRDQHLSREQHKQLGIHFGEGGLHRHALADKGGDDPEILVVKTTKNSKFTAGDGWHTDVSCDPEPIKCSMLYVTEVPESGGGDTLFANMYEAYNQLSEPVREMVDKLSAVHDGALPYSAGYGYDDRKYNKTTHPIVIRHPETGGRILWVNRGFTTHIRGVTRRESRHLLEMLLNVIEATPIIQCRVQWEANTLVIWDNIATQHHAVWDYFPESRYGERVSVVGESLHAAA